MPPDAGRFEGVSAPREGLSKSARVAQWRGVSTNLVKAPTVVSGP